MKKLSLLALSGLFMAAQATNYIPTSSVSYLFTRPAYQNLALHMSLWHNALLNTHKKNSAQIAGYYQKSFRPDTIKEFFLPEFVSLVKVSNTAANRTLLAEWLDLPTNFYGEYTYNPTQEQAGFLFEYRYNIGDFLNLSFLQDSWVFAEAPFVVVKNNMHLTQSNIQNAGATTLPVYDIVTAFQNPEWNYAKVDGQRRKFGLAELRLGFGTTFLSTDRFYAATYTALSIPTHKENSAKYMFDPQIGYNKHPGFIWGVLLEFPVTRANERNIMFQLGLENTFIIRIHEHRTLDLINKQYSRYLLMRTKDQIQDVTTPGVNILTQKVRVAPHFALEFTAGFRAQVSALQIEAGYALWGFGGERLRLHDPWQEIYGIAGTTTNTTASNSTANDRAPNDATFVAIKEYELDLDSAASPSALIHRAYGSIGYVGTSNYKPTIGLGGSVDIPQNPTKALSIWSLWGTLAVSF